MSKMQGTRKTSSGRSLFAESDNPSTALGRQLSKLLQHPGSPGSRTIRMDAPFNLYLSKEQAALYLDAVNEKPFSSRLYEPLIRVLVEHAVDILGPADTPTDFYDLGPGYPDRSAPLIDRLEQNCASLRYLPVDVSRSFLAMTAEFFRGRSFDICPLNIRFEGLPHRIRQDPQLNLQRRRILNIGLTFNNFAPRKILGILRSCLAPGSQAIIATELIDDLSIEDAMSPYASDRADRFNFEMLALIGFCRADFSYRVHPTRTGIEMGFVVERPIQTPSGPLAPGDYLVTSSSRRYRSRDLLRVLHRHFLKARLFRHGTSAVCVATGEG